LLATGFNNLSAGEFMRLSSPLPEQAISPHERQQKNSPDYCVDTMLQNNVYGSKLQDIFI